MQDSVLLDISLPLSPNGITYPNNPDVEFESQPTQTSVITKIKFGSHSGSHIDAPSHAMIKNGATVDQIDLTRFYGRARVVDCLDSKGEITVEDLEKKTIKHGERVLLKTDNSLRGFHEFFPNFVYLTPEAAEFLASKEVLLVGIDSLSIKQKGNPDNRAHTNLLEKGIPILEGLDLSKAEPGDYILSAFPLKFIGIDGAPCRAVLQK